MDMSSIMDRMAQASSMRWYGHVLRKEDEIVIVKGLKSTVRASRGRRLVVNEMTKNGRGGVLEDTF